MFWQGLRLAAMCFAAAMTGPVLAQQAADAVAPETELAEQPAGFEDVSDAAKAALQAKAQKEAETAAEPGSTSDPA